MTWPELVTILGVLGAVMAASPLLAGYLDRVYRGGPAPGDVVLLPVERLVYRVLGTGPEREQRWSAYAVSVLTFGLASTLVLYVLLRTQGVLALNPQGVGGMAPALAFNTATSFVTGTNWQAYSGESAMSHLGQALGLVVAQFTAAASGMAVGVAFLRGLTRRTSFLGNFWVDLTRSITRVLLPMAGLSAVVLVSQGAVQGFSHASRATTLEGAAQMIPSGPAASMAAIKTIGTNGGGLFGAGTAHPFDNPNGLTNAFQLALCLIIPFAFALLYGRWAGDRRQGRVIVAVMLALLVVPILIGLYAEGGGNAELTARGADQSIATDQGGGNMEGKEVRLGTGGSAISTVGTMGTTAGLATSGIGSYTAVGQASSLTPILLGEVSPGGVGTGIVGMLINVALAAFIAGLMVGRTPELLGKSLKAREMKLVVLVVLAVPAIILVTTAASVSVHSAAAAVSQPGPQGFTEILYGSTSAANGNGSSMGGLRAAAPWYLDILGLVMLAGRYLTIVPALALAGALGRRRPRQATIATVPTSSGTFGLLLAGVVLGVGGLTFLPALVLGPVSQLLSR
jgi:K+-transporting ATPase ATPase A chain